MKQRGKRLIYRWITANVERALPVVVATRPVKRHEVIEGSDLRVQTLYLKRQGGEYAMHPKDLIGKRAIRSFHEGAPIPLDWVEEVPVIHRGDEVQLMVEKGALKIVAIGRAKEDGFLGRSIAVVNLESKKTVFGKVIDASTVKIQMK